MTEHNTENTGEGYRIRPFYLCIDVSGSMGPNYEGGSPWPIEVVNDDLAALLKKIRKELDVSEVISLALISFAEGAKLECPLSDPEKIMALPKLQAGGKTSYLKPLKKLREVIEQDFLNLKNNIWLRPVVIFITDGYPNIETDEDWHAARDKLIDPDWYPHPIFVAFGFGKANEEVIEALATGQKYTAVALMASRSETPTTQIKRIISTVQESMLYSIEHPGQFMIDKKGYLVLTKHKNDRLNSRG